MRIDDARGLREHGSTASFCKHHSAGGPRETFLVAKDPDSVPDGSPTLYRTDRQSWVVQGWVVNDSEVLTAMNIPPGETCVEIPDRLVPFFHQDR